ncbi:hypothetical protein PLESTB_000940700 [Pleodorina starrii]|uniref:Uncharacterized protein n=1 Tax=Pleodorina starrii TaxID=330485 RepID=A0A9W6BN76_9CHLO|nr:hypothetical protein PLESTB_000940700 [Pleodorina starrii]GLC71172.1 hypothetical protein PLESTF_001082200 [Pleodorina starrii]
MSPLRAPSRASTPKALNRRALVLLRPARMMQLCCSSKQDVAEPATSTSASAMASTSGTTGRTRAVFKANKLGRQPITEAERPLAEYMSLPASQYSVLDARRIERVDDSTFRCYVGELRFLSWVVEPVITVSVTVEQQEGGCTIRLLGCKLQGSRFVEDINDKFSATMTNVVRYRDYVPPPPAAAAASEDSSDGEEGTEGPAGPSQRHDAAAVVGGDGTAGAGAAALGVAGRGSQKKEIVSDTTIQVTVEVPPWSSFLPVSTLEGVGSGVMQNVLNAMVPRFLAQLATDYALWASGDESRRPVGEL